MAPAALPAVGRIPALENREELGSSGAAAERARSSPAAALILPGDIPCSPSLFSSGSRTRAGITRGWIAESLELQLEKGAGFR